MHLGGPGAVRVNPARAGMIRAGSLRREATAGKPRASGDDPAAEMARRAEAE